MDDRTKRVVDGLSYISFPYDIPAVPNTNKPHGIWTLRPVTTAVRARLTSLHGHTYGFFVWGAGHYYIVHAKPTLINTRGMPFVRLDDSDNAGKRVIGIRESGPEYRRLLIRARFNSVTQRWVHMLTGQILLIDVTQDSALRPYRMLPLVRMDLGVTRHYSFVEPRQPYLAIPPSSSLYAATDLAPLPDDVHRPSTIQTTIPEQSLLPRTKFSNRFTVRKRLRVLCVRNDLREVPATLDTARAFGIAHQVREDWLMAFGDQRAPRSPLRLPPGRLHPRYEWLLLDYRDAKGQRKWDGYHVAGHATMVLFASVSTTHLAYAPPTPDELRITATGYIPDPPNQEELWGTFGDQYVDVEEIYLRALHHQRQLDEWPVTTSPKM